MSIENRLNEIKNLKFKTIKNFSDATKLSYRTAQNYLSGDREPNLDSLNKICTHLSVNLNWLVSGVGEPFLDVGTETKSETAELSKDEQELLANYRQASDSGKFVILSVAQGAEKKVAENHQVQRHYGT